MAWLSRSLGDSVSSLTGQLSNLTKDILTEGTEEVSDHATELSLAKEQIASLESVQASQKTENERLKVINRELEEKAESAELQINSISREYRTLLEEKEKEINNVKHHHHELLEQHAKAALHPAEDAPHTSSVSNTDLPGFQDEVSDFGGWSNESWGEFDDSLRLQREINQLRQEVTQLRADSQHWRSVAGQLSEKGGHDVDQTAQHDLLNLQAKVKELESKVVESREQAQHEVASLQDVHQSKMATLKKRHKEEITQLKSQVSSLEQQLADARDGDSTGTAGSSSVLPESERTETESLRTLQSQLLSVTKERDKIQSSKAHLEGMLDELQREVEALQNQRDEQQARILELEDSFQQQQEHFQQQIAALQTQLQEAESWRVEAEQSRQQVGLDLFHAKHCLLDQLEANHADTADLLSDVRCVRQQLSSETVQRQRRLLVVKQNMAMRLYAAGVQETQLKSSIVETGTQLRQASADTESLIEELGSEEAQQQAADVVDSLERENLVLKEQSVKLQEQITLLEKRLTNQQQDWQTGQETVRALRREIKQLRGGAGSDSDNTLDESFTSDADTKSTVATQPVDETDAGDWQFQKEALEEVLAQLRQEVREKDERISQLSTDGKDDSSQQLASLKEENERLQSELSTMEKAVSSLQDDKEELETSIGELDEQHEEATNHLIAARNTLQSQLSESQQQVKSLQEELQNLSQQQSSPELSPSPSDTSASSEQVEQLRKELQNSQQELETLRRQAESRETEMADLKVKLQKGTLALNDLHMDKKDLEREVVSKQEEVVAKVTAIKTLREEKANLMKENKDLTQRVQDLEDELDSWEQRNEDSQLQKAQLSKLQIELLGLQDENSAQQQKLDSMFVELTESRTLCKRLQQEREALDQKEEQQEIVRERDKAVERVSELEKHIATMSEKDANTGLESSSNLRVEELESQLSGLKQQADVLLEENSALQEEVKRLKAQVLCEDDTDISDLTVHSHQIVRALQRRSAALHKLKKDLGDGSKTLSQPAIDSDLQLSQTGLLTTENVSELCTESRALVDALVGGNTVLEEIQQQYSTVPVEAMPLTRSSTSNLQTTPSQDAVDSSSTSDFAIVQDENKRLTDVIRVRESEISSLKQSIENLQQEVSVSKQSSESLSTRLESLESVTSEKDNELQMLHAENTQLMTICEDSKSKFADSEVKIESLKCQLMETEGALQQCQAELDTVRQKLKQTATDSAFHSQLEKELQSARDKIQQLETKLSRTEETLLSQKDEVEDLNAKHEEKSKLLSSEQAKSSEQDNTIAKLHQSSVTMEEELETVKSQLGRAVKYLSADQCSVILENVAVLANCSDAATEMNSGSKPRENVMQNGKIEIQDSSDKYQLSEKHADLLRQLEEKEDIIADLQQNNTALVQMLEAKSLTSHSGDSTQLDVHRLQSEVKALKVEKEQMLAVMNEKSREASSLKAEVMRLMSVISAEKYALEKLQKDNQELTSRSSPPRDESLEDMQREAMQNLSRLVRDREMEIEALKQKNETLMAVLQDMNQTDGKSQAEAEKTTGVNLASQLADKENLEKQLATLQAEREQMVAFVNQKHSESVTYHAEIQRLTTLRAEETQRFEQLQSDYDTLCPQFEDKSQSLLKVQNDLINYRQKYAELEVKHGELLQKSSASETVDAASFREVEEEKERLLSKQAELQQAIRSGEEKLRAATEKLNEMENTVLSKDSEASALKKQVDSLQFQLRSLGNETTDLRQEQQATEQRHQEQQSQSQGLKDLNNQLTLTVREKEFEVASLQERVQKLTSLVSEQQGEKTQVTQLLRDQEAASGRTAQLQQEVDQLTLGMKQKQQQLNDMQAENLRLKEKEQKLMRELERLRGHLLQIEEGYTREALEAEEREKGLRNRLATAEEQLLASTSQVQSASQQASQQVESLQQQLHSIASQRDAAYMQVATLQEQCQQYSSSLSNLQLVLEQFQKEKESQIASETERYQEAARQLKEKTEKLEQELQQAKVELEEASDGLAAASRLSEQLDRKEEVLQAMREEVHHRENALRNAEEEIHKLTSTKEAKVDRVLMKNLLLGYFHTPDRNRMDAIHAIGSVLGFTQEDFHKIDESQGGGGWMSGLFRRARTPTTTPPTTPVHPHSKGPNQSFSQLFVKFLEVESTPPPAPVRMPAEEMAREAQQRHHIKERNPRDKPAFNPFTAPRHVSMPIAVGSAAAATASSGSHILMAPPPGSPTTAFPVFTPFSSAEGSTPQNSSAILKDVLGSR